MRTVGLRLAGDLVTVAVDDDGAATFATCAADEVAAKLEELDAASARIGAGFSAPVSTRVFRFPFVQPGKIRQALPLLLDDHIPGELADYERLTVIDRDDDGGVARVWLTTRAALQPPRDTMTAAGDARVMEHEALLAAPPPRGDAHAFVWLTPRATTVVARADEAPVALFSVPIGLDHLDDEHALADLRTRLVAGLDAPVDTWIVDGWGRGNPHVDTLMAGIGDGGAWYWADLAPGMPDDPAQRIALLAARTVAERTRPVWNLGPPRRLPLMDAMRHPLVRALAPVAAVLLLVSILAVRAGTAALEARADAGRRELTAIYERNFPGSRIVDPLRQMRSVADRARGSGPAVDAAPLVERLSDFHAAVSAGSSLALSELRSASGDWTLKGEAADFGAVDRFKRELESLEWPADVRVQRAEQTVDKTAIRFQIAFADEGAP